MTPIIFIVLATQALLGAFDNLWHHELEARLPHRVGARRELMLHAAREAIYGVVFLTVAWLECLGVWAFVLGALLFVEVIITLADFVEEDRTRRLPPFERLLHTVLTALYGGFLVLMSPVLVGWARQPTALVISSHGLVSALFTAFSIGVLAWAVRNAWAVHVLSRNTSLSSNTPAASAMAQHRLAVPTLRFTVLVTGGTGFVGQSVVMDLVKVGRRVIVLSRDTLQARSLFGPGVVVIDRLDILPAETRIDSIVHLAGARVLGMPWTRSRRRTLIESRAAITEALLALIRRLHHRPQVFVAASAVGFYGVTPGGMATHDQGHTPCDESSPPRPGQFASDMCIAIEHEARRAEALGVRVVQLRFGLILGRDGGAWPMQALAARLGLGAVVGSGRQAMPWVHVDDAVGLIRFALDTQALSGPVNAVAPESCTQRLFAQAMAGAFGRCAWLRAPDALLRMLGGEMMSLMLDGQAVTPRTALIAGYCFRHPTLPQACRNLAGTNEVRHASLPTP